MKKILNFAVALLAVLMFVACEEDKVSGETENRFVGCAQKGQMIKGASITAYALDERLMATGESFPGVIKNDLGSFDISTRTIAPYLELKAEGYYFVENTGSISEAPIYLTALVAAEEENANINLLTTITNGRIRKLVAEGKTFAAAKSQAENEALKALSMENVSVGFEKMNIAEDGEANAVLLAVSCLMQQDRTAGELQSLVSDVSEEFERTGSLSRRLLDAIFNSGRSVDVVGVVRNLISFYKEKGVENFKIPSFYAMLDKDYAEGVHVLGAISSYYPDGFDTDAQGGTKQFYVLSREAFTAESNVDWMTAEVAPLCTAIYVLTITVLPNPEVGGREGYVYVKNEEGQTAYAEKTRQRGNGQRIYLGMPGVLPRSAADARMLSEGDKVNVNGTDFVLAYDTSMERCYVDVPKSDKGYGITNMPEMLQPAANGDVLCATIVYKSEVDDLPDGGDEAVEGTRSQATSGDGSYDLVISQEGAAKNEPYYAALKGMADMELPNPANADLYMACSKLSLRFEYAGSTKLPEFHRMEIETDAEGFLSGEVTTCMYPDQAMLDPNYVLPETECRNKSNKVTVVNADGDNVVSLLVHPQTVAAVKCTAYDAAGNVAFVVEANPQCTLKRGYRMALLFSVAEE